MPQALASPALRGEVLDRYDKIREKESKGKDYKFTDPGALLAEIPKRKQPFVGFDAGIDRYFNVVVNLPLAVN